MWAFLTKDLLLFWRDRKEVAVIILLPIVLVVLLSLVVPGMFGEETSESYDLDLALVVEDQQDQGFERFQEEVEPSNDQSQQMIDQLQAMPPVDGLVAYLNSPELAEWVTVNQMDLDQAQTQVDEGELDAALIIPEHYTYQLLNEMVLDEPSEATLQFQASGQSQEVDMLRQMIQRYLDQINLQYAVASSGSQVDSANDNLPEGGVENVEGQSMFSMEHYFTFSMAALFTLFLAATVATRTGIEKREQTFNRIALTNAPPLYYLMGKTISTFILAWLQMMFVLVGAHLILGVFTEEGPTFWVGLIVMATLYALAIAAISSIMTSTMLRVKNNDTGDGIFMAVVMVLGVIGGNFVPINVLPNWLQQIGELTPNGLILATLTEWVQDQTYSLLVMPTVILVAIIVTALSIGIAVYPKRGEQS
ncbi:ABC transporter permease [Alkalibacillus salilacus]|uniref:ABC-2 type transport system permease protein n=1 Tax=Alkalibacillus salilacus TaxID=284582 RepID=A0ABT9VB70_9BACI|nr:ABC transporter permease [Alkalibacillus salilacus]MDQ0158202.1 ABC-2 type transport system permease protein [Alkalibacillus salilacus]